MRTNDHPSKVYRRLACLAVLMTTSLAPAQVPPTGEPKPEQSTAPAAAKPQAAPIPVDTAKEKIPTKQEVTAAGKGEQATLADDGETLVLSPFQVSTANDRGYRGSSTMSGTRMGADLDDIANPISVVTKQQLRDFAARDINDIFASEVSVEGTHTYTANFNDGKQDVDSVALNPETANRVRGLGAANISVGNFGKSSTIPIDIYNVDAVEISRGPNSSIFGMGEASGTVNLVPSTANITKDLSNVSASYSNFGTARGSFDLNRVLWRNKFALRVTALENHQGFVREPSYDKTRRYQFSGTFQPFKLTTIRATYEKFKESYSRPNSVTPRELMSLWNENGRPSWNPSTNQWAYGAHTDSSNWLYYPAATGVTTPPNNSANPAFPAGTSVWLAAYGTSIARPTMFIDQGQVQWAGTSYWAITPTPVPADPLVRRELLSFGTPVNYGVPDDFRGTLPYSAIKSTKDKSFYDYESLNLAALNYGAKEAETTRVELEQFFLNTPTHVLAAQLGFFKERIEDYRRTFVGNGGDGVPLYIYPDVNLTYPDGTPNPYFGRPLINALAPQTYVNPIDTKTYRANLVYQLDLTKQKNFLHHLGRMKILGYGETFEKVQAPKYIRYLDSVTANYSPWLAPSRNTNGTINNSGQFNVRYYLGDANGGNVDYAPKAQPINNTITYNRWGATGEPTVNNWYGVDGVQINPNYFAMAKQQTQTTTEGFILQNYLVQDRVITTWGRRLDTLRTRDSMPEPAWAKDPASNMSTTLDWMDDFTDRPWNPTNKQTGATKASGYTDNIGVVVKPFRWLSLRYNQSSSFKPEDYGIDFQGNPLQNSGGESKDYGFALNLFKNKLIIGLTRYETFAKDSRANDINTVAQRITNLDYDISPSSNSVNFDLEDWLYNELFTRDGAPATPTQAQIDGWNAEAHQLMKLTDERILANRTYTRAMTADRKATGYELTIDYNPNPYFSLKMNGSQQETIYTNVGQTWQDYRDERMGLWTTIASPNPTNIDPLTGQRRLWWTTPFGGVTPATHWIGENAAPMQVQLALQGKPVPQSAKYRANALARYRLAGMFKSTPVVKDLTIGGKVSWIDRSAIGFYAAPPVPIRDPTNLNNTIIRSVEYDVNRPIMNKAETYVDVFATYDFRLYHDRIRGSVQLNVKNVAESGRLQPFGVNPDGSYYNYRIIDPREYILSLNFDL